ncbi:MAG: phosphonoacetaldehyde hydrolase, partial [Bryobacteraceae bacterium]
MWTIAIARTGNEVGLSEAEWNRLSQVEQNNALAKARSKFSAADFVVDSVADCDEALDRIESGRAQTQCS